MRFKKSGLVGKLNSKKVLVVLFAAVLAEGLFVPGKANAAENDYIIEDAPVHNGVGGVDDIMPQYFSFFGLMPEAEYEGSYYSQLDDNSKVFYQALLKFYSKGPSLSNCSISFNKVFKGLKTYLVDDQKMIDTSTAYAEVETILLPAMLAVMYDHPEISWIDNVPYSYGILEYTVSNNDDGTVDLSVSKFKVFFKNQNVGTPAEMNTAISTAKEVIDAKIAVAGESGQTDYGKARIIHDYIADSIIYNYCSVEQTLAGVSRTYSDSENKAYQTAYSAFYICNNDETYYKLGKNYTVCAGYARGFKVLCDAYNIPCVYVTGNAYNLDGSGGGHAWNYVKLYGHWYAVDCTWDDPGTAVSGNIVYKYFMTGDDEIIDSRAFGVSHKSSGIWLDIKEGSESYCPVFQYPELSKVKYCEHKDADNDGICDITTCKKILGANLSVSLEGWKYGEKPNKPVVTMAGASDVDGVEFLYKRKDAEDTEYSEEIPTEVGDYIVKAKIEKRDSQYDICLHRSDVNATAEFSIAKGEWNLDINGYEGVYDGESHDAVILPQNLPEEAVITYSEDDGVNWKTAILQVKNVADSVKKIKVKVAGTDNYNEQVTEVGISITKKGITVTPDENQSKEKDEADPVLTYKVSGLVGNDTASVINGKLARIEGEDRGFYEITIGTLTADNYEITLKSGVKFEIEKLTPVIAVTAGQGKEYDKTPLATLEVTGVEELAAVSFSYCKTADGEYEDGLPTDAGDWYVVAATEETANYKAGKSQPAKVVITPKQLKIYSVEVENKTYDGSVNAKVLSIKFVDSDNEEVILQKDSYTAIGILDNPDCGLKKPVKVTVSFGDDITNYIWDEKPFEGEEIDVLKAERNLEITGYSGTYDSSSHNAVVLTDDIQEEALVVFSEDGGITWSETVPEVKNVADTGKVISVKVAETTNYLEQITDVEINIQKKNITVIPDAGQAKEYGETDPEFTFTVEGLAPKETKDVMIGKLARKSGEDKGTYEITIGTLKADNYNIKLVSGVTFEIQKITPVINITVIHDKAYDKEPVAADEIVVEGVMEDAEIFYSYSKTADGAYTLGLPKDAGTWYVVASTAGTANYKPGKSAPKKVVISQAELKLLSVTADNKVYDGNTAATVSKIVFVDENGDNVDIGKNDYTVTAVFDDANSGAGKNVTVTVILKTTVVNYTLKDGSFLTTATIKKAIEPFTSPDKNMTVPYTCEKISDISLPENWEWDEPFTDIELEAGKENKVKVVYVGEDKNNFDAIGFIITITRLSKEEDKPSTETKPQNPPSGGGSSEESSPGGNNGSDKGDSGKPQTTEKPHATEEKVTLPVKNEKKTDPKTKAELKVTNAGKIVDGKVTDAEVKYVKPEKAASKVNVPDTVTVGDVTYKVTSIDTGAFKNNKKLTTVTIGKNVKTISKDAFLNCKKLKTVTIKSTNIKSIGKNAFKNIHKNATIKVPKSKLNDYKKKFTSKTGFKKTMKIKKK